MFAPTQDRDELGMGFTHKTGDIVTIVSPKLGTLVNRKRPSSSLGAFMANLAQRRLINTRQAG